MPPVLNYIVAINSIIIGLFGPFGSGNSHSAIVRVAQSLLTDRFFYKQKKQSARLPQRSGPEYGRAVDELGGRTKGESEQVAINVGQILVPPR